MSLPLDQIRARLGERHDLWEQKTEVFAAVALILHDHPEHGPEILFIQRTEREGDRWSGHMALPGGKVDETDADVIDTARREAFEEVGVELGEPIGRLPNAGRSMFGHVACVAFEVPERPEVIPDPLEVDTAVWIPLGHLLDRENTFRYRHRRFRFDAIRYDDHVVWGLTHGIMRLFSDLLEVDFPDTSTRTVMAIRRWFWGSNRD